MAGTAPRPSLIPAHPRRQARNPLSTTGWGSLRPGSTRAVLSRARPYPLADLPSLIKLALWSVGWVPPLPALEATRALREGNS
jgi:hypothetical protein